MIKFYLNNQEVQVLVHPQQIETLDTSLDSFSLVLKYNQNSKPYAPCQPFKIVENEKTYNFIVVSDNVSLISTDPLLYSHSLQLAQNIRILDKHLLRNTIFSQPANKNRFGYTAIPKLLKYDGGYSPVYNVNGGEEKWIESLIISKKEKVKKTYIKLSCSYVDSNNDLIDGDVNEFLPIYRISVKRASDETVAISFDIADDTPLNKWIEIGDVDVETNDGYEIQNVAQKLNEFNDGSGFTINPLTYARNQTPRFIVVRAEMKAETYYYTAYDIINTILKQSRKSTSVYAGNLLFNLPESGELYDLLNDYVPPTMCFTQNTVFEALSSVFILFDAIFTLDENNVLGIEYLNDRNRKQVYKSDMAGVSSSISENRYNNGVVSYYQNAITEERFPTTNLKENDKKGFAGLRCKTLGIAAEYDWYFMTPKNIEYISRLYSYIESTCNLPDLSQGQQPVGLSVKKRSYCLDITPYIFEKSLYDFLDNSLTFPRNDNYQLKSQNNCILYTKGTNLIEIGTLTYRDIYNQELLTISATLTCAWNRFMGFKTDTINFVVNPTLPGYDWGKYKFKIEYLANVDGRAKVESYSNKFNGNVIINQGAGKLDLERLGLNCLGMSLKLGQPTLAFSHRISNFDDKIEKGQIYIDEEGETWVANVCTYKIIDTDLLEGNIEFSKNFNSLSNNVRLDNEKRLSNISNDLTTKCEDDYCEYLYFSQDYAPLDQQPIVFNQTYIADAIVETMLPKGNFESLNVAVWYCYYEDRQPIFFGDKQLPASGIYIPLIKYGFGNALCFEMSFDSPISAGKQTSISPTWYANKYYTIEYLYTDDEGWADLVSIGFHTMENDFSQEFPYIYNDLGVGSQKGAINFLEYYKKPNEIFALNYELICLTKPDRVNTDFIGRAFIKDNALVNEYLSINKTYFYYETTDDFKYSVLDIYGNGTNVEEITNVSYEIVQGNIVVRVEIGNIQENIKAWSICNANKEILLASNECVNFQNGILTLYFITRHTRL